MNAKKRNGQVSMTRTKTIVEEIKKRLKDSDPHLTEEQIARRNKILNSDNPNFKGYGHKMAELEKLARETAIVLG